MTKHSSKENFAALNHADVWSTTASGRDNRCQHCSYLLWTTRRTWGSTRGNGPLLESRRHSDTKTKRLESIWKQNRNNMNHTIMAGWCSVAYSERRQRGGTTSQDDVTPQLRGRQRRPRLSISDQNSSGAPSALATNQGAAGVEGAKNQGAGAIILQSWV